MKYLLSSLALLLSINTFANELFTVSKSHNKRNVLHYEAEIKNCKLKGIKAYWVMGEEKGQIQGLSNLEKNFFQPKMIGLTDSHAEFTLGALKAAERHIPGGIVTVDLLRCKAMATAEVDGRTIEPIELYSHGKISIFAGGWKSEYMILTGRLSDGTIVKEKFEDLK